MPSSYSFSLRLTLQAPGENNNTWGALLNNQALQFLEDSVAGAVALTVSGPVTLSALNGQADQARQSTLVCSGTGGTITTPGQKKGYMIDATAATGPIVVTTGSGSAATVEAGNRINVNCPDGVNWNVVRDVAGQAAILAQAKSYTDNKVLASSGSLPGSSSPRAVVYTDPATGNAIWKNITTADISDAASRKFALAMACASRSPPLSYNLLNVAGIDFQSFGGVTTASLADLIPALAAGTAFEITDIAAANIDGSSAYDVTVTLKKNGGSNYQIVPAVTVAAKAATVMNDLGIMMQANDSLQIMSNTAAKFHVVVSGKLYT